MGDSRALPGFGEVDLDLGDDIGPEGEAPPESTSRTAAAPKVSDAAKRVHEEATRIVAGDALSAFTRSQPPPPLRGTGGAATRMGTLDDDLLAVARGDDAPASESGIATRDDRVAAMRELYARGDAEAALELAASVRGDAMAPQHSADHPDASIFVQVTGEEEISDPFGGLIPIEEGTVSVESAIEDAVEGVDVVRSMLSLTQRQSIPRVTKSPAQIAKLPIDPRGGFLLAQVDGMQTLEEILDVCAMPAAEALEVIEHLQSLGVIEYD
jgi:hypothetical protein